MVAEVLSAPGRERRERGGGRDEIISVVLRISFVFFVGDALGGRENVSEGSSIRRGIVLREGMEERLGLSMGESEREGSGIGIKGKEQRGEHKNVSSFREKMIMLYPGFSYFQMMIIRKSYIF